MLVMVLSNAVFTDVTIWENFVSHSSDRGKTVKNACIHGFIIPTLRCVFRTVQYNKNSFICFQVLPSNFYLLLSYKHRKNHLQSNFQRETGDRRDDFGEIIKEGNNVKVLDLECGLWFHQGY